MTTRIGAPQVGQRAASGVGDWRGVGWPSRGWPCTIIRRMVARDGTAGMEKAEVADFHEAVGKTCWRNRRRNSMTSRWVVRRRALPTLR